MRTVLAYLVAPLTTPVLIAAILTSQANGGGDRIATFSTYLLIATSTAYPVAWGTGTIVLAVLRRAKRETLITYTCAAAVIGAAYGVVIGWGSSTPEHLELASIFAALAAPTGAVFHLIRGRSPTSRFPAEPAGSRAN